MGQDAVSAFQHVLTMCPGAIAVPLILAGALGLDEKETAFLVSANFFTSGIAILIQVLGIGKLAGSRYPIVLGSSFAPLSPMILIGKEYGWSAILRQSPSPLSVLVSASKNPSMKPPEIVLI